MSNQCARILTFMELNGSITQIEALKELGILRLASRINELKYDEGFNIRKEMVEVKNRWGEKCKVAKYYVEEK